MKKLMFAAVAAVAIAGYGVEPKESGTTYVRDALQKYVDSGVLPGAVSILYRDGVQETCCIGYADMATKRPITLDSAFMQCSQTKGFCGVTIAKLVEDGKLKLDDPVSKYIPEFATLSVRSAVTNGTYTVAPATNALTIRMCLNHTGGFAFELPNYGAMGGWSRRMPLKSVAIMAAAIPLNFEPGTKVSYSNVGIDVGAAVVEVITGKRWETYLQETVLDPLGMKDSTFWPTDAQLANKIELYSCSSNAPARWHEFNVAMGKPYNGDRVFSSAGAGLWTTARDQIKFYKMLMNLGVGDNGARVLKEETVKSIIALSTRPQGKTADGKYFGGYSLGLWASEKDSEDATFGHGGAWGTNCKVNWHKRELRFWVIQKCGGPNPWKPDLDAAYDKFFKHNIDNGNSDAYTGRMK